MSSVATTVAAPAMASSGHNPVSTLAPSTTAVISGSDYVEIREYEKIIQFRDRVVSGKHPRIKVPASSVVKNASATLPPPPVAPVAVSGRVTPSSTHLPTNDAAANGRAMGNALSFQANSQQPAVTVQPPAPAHFIPGVSRPFGSGKPEIDPVLLQKSDGLVKAEIQIQRQRLEKILRDQVEEKRAHARNNQQSNEQLLELDLSDILAKAVTLAQATAPPISSVLPSPTANASDASDSFDENTFYSSQHDTPESRPSVPARSTLDNNVQIHDVSIPASQIDNYTPTSEVLTSRPVIIHTGGPLRTDILRNTARGPAMGAQSAPSPAVSSVPVQTQSMVGISRIEPQNVLNRGRQREQQDAHVISSDSRDASRSDNSGNTDSEQSADQLGLQNPPQLVSDPSLRQHEPLIRGHNLSPFAPQPAHVSPLAIARHPHAREPDTTALQRVPAQVTALRQEHAVVISPESSPQGDKGSKRKNKKKNKRKADARGQDGQGTPKIKPEPRSPSPLAAPPFIRPQKRARRLGRQDPEIIYDEPIRERPSPQLQHERYPPLPVHVERVPHSYGGVDDPYSRQVRPSVGPDSHRIEPPLYEERRSDGSVIHYVRRVPSPSGYIDPYDPLDSRPIPTGSYAVANSNIREVPAYHREERMSVRPYADRARSRSPILIERRSSAMPPPSAPPRRVVVDEFGREYLEPVRAATISRRSAVPPSRPGDPEIIYERTPVRASSRIPAPEIVGEDGVIYRRASPGYAPRRVITQPEYGAGFRSYRERDYPVQSMGPLSQEFVQIHGATEHLPREYLPRAASVRPVESVPYDRLSSTRPDIPSRQYTASVHPDGREIAAHVGRSYSVRPTEMEVSQRAYSVRPMERYYEQPPREDDITYIERPRAVHQETIYPGNSVQRQVYQ
ncbi:hypothetical protein F4777DRAFT_529202 [Nemania sp. FL0916]|nr:hypothetical protein F4777DRAFT_529202 [Nemania sp. FL0916]